VVAAAELVPELVAALDDEGADAVDWVLPQPAMDTTATNPRIAAASRDLACNLRSAFMAILTPLVGFANMRH
jgi:hypothetical protein